MAEITLTRPYLAPPGLFPSFQYLPLRSLSPYSLHHSPHSPSSTLQLLTSLQLCNSSFLSYRPISLSGRVRPCIPLSHGCPSLCITSSGLPNPHSDWLPVSRLIPRREILISHHFFLHPCISLRHSTRVPHPAKAST
jgi:hypothetical protein